ncbi:unnamed protein product [Callosobruchus maculatus]|uniref:G patch domain-containing protein n=1 Tax=Callosobruchus maculatus TaxID=64391 RepID=A0A653BE95_CALMS|nr:unnamed protein product [Callosobruchus maculatus]
MSGSDSDDSEQAFCFFGTPLDPLDKDEIPRKRPISVEEQIATDSHGRRRFHGAFTGGFSAGFFNTVGSLEGWTPNDFKSSRTEKAQIMVQKPEDFMDDEDVGEFGIAPKTIKATRDYSTAKKRKRMLANGPIPGEPVLNTFISSGNETIGYLLLKNIGIQDKIAKKNWELGVGTSKVYGCEMPSTCEISGDVEKKLYNMPTIYVECLAKPKNNTFGIGYKGLDRTCHNAHSSTNLIVKEGNNKNIHVVGQAFGVGAFEEDDDDIYSKEDLSNYDFELTQEKTKAANSASFNRDVIFSIFRKNNLPLLYKKQFPVIVIPPGFSGKHKKRISRFEPVKENTDFKSKPKNNASVRAKYLSDGDEKASNSTLAVTEIKVNNNVSIKEEKDKIHSLLTLDRFVSASHKEEMNNILEPVHKTITCYGSQQMQDAVKMKMFGPLTRTTSDWHPHPLLCERFNVPEPLMDKPQTNQKKRRKNLIFEQQICVEESSILKSGLAEESIKSKCESDKDLSDSIILHKTNIDPDKDMNRKRYESDIENKILPQSETVKGTDFQSQTINDTVCQSEEVEANDSEIQLSKTEVESKDITEKINIAEKVDLFKAVFLSSDDSEEEIEQEDSSKDKKELFKMIVSEPLIPIVKNTKQGILSNLSFNKPPEECSNVERAKEEGLVKNQLNTISSTPLYGPCLPAQKCTGNKESISKINKANIQKISSDSSDEWVEKDDTTHKKNKKNKKKKVKERKHRKHKKHSH